MPGATGYKLYRAPDATPIYTGALLTYSDTGRTNGVQYCYTIKAYNSCGDGTASAPGCWTATVAPCTGAAARTLPAGYGANQPMSVSVSVIPPQGTTVYAVEDPPSDGL